MASRSWTSATRRVVAHLGVASGHRDLAVGEEQHALGHLVGGDPLAEEGLDVLGGGVGTVLEGDAGDDQLVEPVVGHADDAAQLHGRAGPELHLELGGRHVGAPRLDHLGAAAAEVELAPRVDVAGVAGVEEAVGVEALLRGLAEVALHDGRAGEGQLALLVDAEGGAGVGVDHAEAVAGQERAHAPLRGLAVGGAPVAGEERARLGEAVADGHEPLRVAGDARVAGEGRLPEHAPQRREVGGRPVRVLLEGGGLVGERVRLRHPLAGDQGERVPGLEHLLHDPAAAGGERGAHRRVEARGPEHRERRPHAGGLVAAEDLGLHPELERRGAVPVEHALRQAGGARAEDHQCGVVGLRAGDAGIELAVGDVVGQGEQRVPRGLAEHRDVPEVGQVGLQRLEVVAEASGPAGGSA